MIIAYLAISALIPRSAHGISVQNNERCVRASRRMGAAHGSRRAPLRQGAHRRAPHHEADRLLNMRHASCAALPKQLLNDLVGALQLVLELLRADEVLFVAGALGYDARKLWRDLDIGMGRKILGLRHDLLAFAAQDE